MWAKQKRISGPDSALWVPSFVTLSPDDLLSFPWIVGSLSETNGFVRTNNVPHPLSPENTAYVLVITLSTVSGVVKSTGPGVGCPLPTCFH